MRVEGERVHAVEGGWMHARRRRAGACTCCMFMWSSPRRFGSGLGCMHALHIEVVKPETERDEDEGWPPFAIGVPRRLLHLLIQGSWKHHVRATEGSWKRSWKGHASVMGGSSEVHRRVIGGSGKVPGKVMEPPPAGPCISSYGYMDSHRARVRVRVRAHLVLV